MFSDHVVAEPLHLIPDTAYHEPIKKRVLRNIGLVFVSQPVDMDILLDVLNRISVLDRSRGGRVFKINDSLLQCSDLGRQRILFRTT